MIMFDLLKPLRPQFISSSQGSLERGFCGWLERDLKRCGQGEVLAAG